MLVARLAAIADDLETTNHLADGEEAEALGEDDAAAGEVGGVEAADLLEEVLGHLEVRAALNGAPEILVRGLEGGH